MTEAALLVGEYEKSLTNATENYRLINANYQAGLATITDLLTAQTTQLKAQNELTDAQQRFDSVITLKNGVMFIPQVLKVHEEPFMVHLLGEIEAA